MAPGPYFGHPRVKNTNLNIKIGKMFVFILIFLTNFLTLRSLSRNLKHTFVNNVHKSTINKIVIFCDLHFYTCNIASHR